MLLSHRGIMLYLICGTPHGRANSEPPNGALTQRGRGEGSGPLHACHQGTVPQGWVDSLRPTQLVRCGVLSFFFFPSINSMCGREVCSVCQQLPSLLKAFSSWSCPGCIAQQGTNRKQADPSWNGAVLGWACLQAWITGKRGVLLHLCETGSHPGTSLMS